MSKKPARKHAHLKTHAERNAHNWANRQVRNREDEDLKKEEKAKKKETAARKRKSAAKLKVVKGNAKK